MLTSTATARMPRHVPNLLSTPLLHQGQPFLQHLSSKAFPLMFSQLIRYLRQDKLQVSRLLVMPPHRSNRISPLRNKN